MTGQWGRRIWILGPPGAGKTTLGRALQAALDVPLIQLDRLFWEPGWRRADDATFRAAVTDAAAADRWVIDGQYDTAHPTLRDRADMVIWLDTGTGTALRRLLRRTVRRLVSREELWNGNRERVTGAVQLLAWAVREYPRVRAYNTGLYAELDRGPARCVRVRNPRDLRALLSAAGDAQRTIGSAGAPPASSAVNGEARSRGPNRSGPR